jgi:hypothetical protein
MHVLYLSIAVSTIHPFLMTSFNIFIHHAISTSLLGTFYRRCNFSTCIIAFSTSRSCSVYGALSLYTFYRHLFLANNRFFPDIPRLFLWTSETRISISLREVFLFFCPYDFHISNLKDMYEYVRKFTGQSFIRLSNL